MSSALRPSMPRRWRWAKARLGALPSIKTAIYVLRGRGRKRAGGVNHGEDREAPQISTVRREGKAVGRLGPSTGHA